MLDQVARQLRAHAEACGHISKDWGFLATPLWIPDSEVTPLTRDLARLEDIIFSLPERQYGGSCVAMGIDLGIDPQLAQMFSGVRAQQARFPLRWDLIKSAGQYKVLELNTGFCLGGFNTDGLAAAYRQVDKRFMAGRFLPTEVMLGDYVSSLVQGRVHIVEFDHLIDSYGFFAQALSSALGRHSSLSCSWGPLSQLRWVGDQFTVQGEPINAVIPMMTFQELHHSAMAREFLSRVLAVPEVSLLSPTETLFTHKGILALLHDEKTSSLFTPEERAVVDRLVPETWRVTAQHVEQVLVDSGLWVLKPCDSYGGHGVVCQWDTLHWKDALINALNSGQSWILQRAVRAQAGEFVTVSPAGKVTYGSGEPVLGLITIEQALVGGGARVILNISQPGVTNAHNGAAPGWIFIDENA